MSHTEIIGSNRMLTWQKSAQIGSNQVPTLQKSAQIEPIFQ